MTKMCSWLLTSWFAVSIAEIQVFMTVDAYIKHVRCNIVIAGPQSSPACHWCLVTPTLSSSISAIINQREIQGPCDRQSLPSKSKTLTNRNTLKK